jgi:hypothetical protein
MPQRPDVDQIKKVWALKPEGRKSQQEMAEELGLNPRTISNYFRPAWLAQRSTLENRAWEKCGAGDHSWMSDEAYRVHA